MLVVICVVVILSALAFPTATRAIEVSRKMSCSSNLRTLHTGLSLYANEHNGFYPAPTDNPLSSGGVGTWSMVLMLGDYIGVRAVTANVKNPFLCPEAYRTYSNRLARRTYTMNTLPATASAVSALRLSRPTQTIILADGVDGGAGEGDTIFYFRSSSISRIDPRHGGSFNALFVDGHISEMKKTDPDLVSYLDNLQQ
ncbi:MAG: hypothetical protein B9S32_17255 [Verrucomicrobia bacterium Tous-C9LFEB]|nr:MAG: hypothetical protein B9S32_17255 [Verrucomicrobia bacterium Tous-C9LFEB]